MICTRAISFISSDMKRGLKQRWSMLTFTLSILLCVLLYRDVDGRFFWQFNALLVAPLFGLPVREPELYRLSIWRILLGGVGPDDAAALVEYALLWMGIAAC